MCVQSTAVFLQHVAYWGNVGGGGGSAGEGKNEGGCWFKPPFCVEVAYSSIVPASGALATINHRFECELLVVSSPLGCQALTPPKAKNNWLM